MTLTHLHANAGLTTIELHQHPRYNVKDDVIEYEIEEGRQQALLLTGKVLKKYYEAYLSGKYKMTGDDATARVDCKDRSWVKEENEIAKVLIKNDKYKEYMSLREEGITDYLKAESSYSTKTVQSGGSNPERNTFLIKFKELSLSIDENNNQVACPFYAVSQTISIDDDGNETTTTNYSNAIMLDVLPTS